MIRNVRKMIFCSTVKHIHRHVSYARMAEEMGYSKHLLYAWRNDPKAAPTEEQLEDFLEWVREWRTKHELKQAQPMSR